MRDVRENIWLNKISFEEYDKIRKILLISIEQSKKEIYKDIKGVYTIGIGINIGRFGGLWIKLILYYLFDLTKKIDEIPFKRFDNNFKDIIKDTHSYKYKEYQDLINNISNTIFQAIKADTPTATLNQITQKL